MKEKKLLKNVKKNKEKKKIILNYYRIKFHYIKIMKMKININ